MLKFAKSVLIRLGIMAAPVELTGSEILAVAIGNFENFVDEMQSAIIEADIELDEAQFLLKEAAQEVQTLTEININGRKFLGNLRGLMS